MCHGVYIRDASALLPYGSGTVLSDLLLRVWLCLPGLYDHLPVALDGHV